MDFARLHMLLALQGANSTVSLAHKFSMHRTAYNYTRIYVKKMYMRANFYMARVLMEACSSAMWQTTVSMTIGFAR